MVEETQALLQIFMSGGISSFILVWGLLWLRSVMNSVVPWAKSYLENLITTLTSINEGLGSLKDKVDVLETRVGNLEGKINADQAKLVQTVIETMRPSHTVEDKEPPTAPGYKKE